MNCGLPSRPTLFVRRENTAVPAAEQGLPASSARAGESGGGFAGESGPARSRRSAPLAGAVAGTAAARVLPNDTLLRGMTLIEVVVSLGLGLGLLTVVLVLFLFGLRSFAALGNYASLTGQSHLAFDRISREIQEATQVIDVQTNLPVKWLTLSNAVATPPEVIKYTWDSTTGVLTCDKTGQSTQTNLTGCDAWDFSFYQSNPAGNWTFIPTTDPALCRSIAMSWRCSRTILGQKLTTEEMVTAQIVRRNKL